MKLFKPSTLFEMFSYEKLEAEYKLIVAKKSKLSATKRDQVVKEYKRLNGGSHAVS